MRLIKYIALVGDGLFVLWILYNGIDEGFKGITTIQGIIPLFLALLLTLNLFVIWKQTKF